MCSDMELFINLIYMTKTMKNLQDTNFDKYLECIKQTQDWEKFKDVSDITKLNNNYINKAIKEIINNKEYTKIIKDTTKMDWKKIEKTLENCKIL